MYKTLIGKDSQEEGRTVPFRDIENGSFFMVTGGLFIKDGDDDSEDGETYCACVWGAEDHYKAGGGRVGFIDTEPVTPVRITQLTVATMDEEV